MGNLNINIDEITPAALEYTPIPPDKYEAHIVEAVVKITKAGTGQYLKLTFEVLEGEFAKRKIFMNLTVKNPSPKAQEIGLGQLSTLCKALGKSGIVDDSSELLNIPVLITVRVEDSDYDGKPQNVIKGFDPTAATVRAKAVLAKVVGADVIGPDDDQIPF
jgi:hypothetical protein